MGNSKKVVSSRVLLSINDNSLELQQWFSIHDFWCLERLQLPSLTVPAAYITLENEGLMRDLVIMVIFRDFMRLLSCLLLYS